MPTCCVKGALARLVDDGLPGDRLQLGDDLPPGLPACQDAAAWARLSDGRACTTCMGSLSCIRASLPPVQGCERAAGGGFAACTRRYSGAEVPRGGGLLSVRVGVHMCVRACGGEGTWLWGGRLM